MPAPRLTAALFALTPALVWGCAPARLTPAPVASPLAAVLPNTDPQQGLVRHYLDLITAERLCRSMVAPHA
jgi:hypothetical protein